MRRPGFTVIELLVVLAAIGLLLAVAAPRYIQHVDLAREVALKESLRQMRDAIDKFYADQGRYPGALEELVVRHYLRAVPEDPLTQRRDSWVVVAPSTGETSGGPPQAVASTAAAVFDIRSGASGRGRDGTEYRAW